MLLGITIEPAMLIAGGVGLFVLIAFQILVGLRKIKFKGRTHLKVHKWAAYAILVMAVFHGIAALTYLGVLGA